MNRVLSSAVFLSVAVLLQACAPAPEPTAATESAAAAAEPAAAPLPVNEPAAPATTFNTSNTVRDIMNLMVEANARQLWDAVSYVATAEGVQETLPQTDADWQRLRAHAVALIEAGNALMLPGRLIDHPENLDDYEEFMYTPAEIEQLISTDPESWAYNLQEMQAATINQACESCHAQYWYRPLPMQGAEGLR